MSFHPKLDQFYASATFGIMKFMGTEPDGAWVFDRFEKSFATRGSHQGWFVKDRLKANPEKFRALIATAVPPPQ